MAVKNEIAGRLFKAVRSGRLTFHSSIRLYKVIDGHLSKKLSESNRFASRKIIEHMLAATSPGAKSAWTSVLFPCELLYPFGIYPLTLEVLAATFSTLGLSPSFLDRSDASDVPPTMCSFHRVLIGLAKSDFIVSMPLLVGSTSVMCDGNVKSFAEAAKEKNVPFIFVDVPYEEGEDGVSYVRNQLKDVVRQLEDAASVKFDSERFGGVVLNINRSFGLARRLYELRRTSRSNISRGFETANFIFPMHFLLGSEALPGILDAKCTDLREGKRHNRFFGSLYYGKAVKRIMWLHVVPQYDTPMWGIVDNGVNTRMVCDEYSALHFEDYDLKDPLGSIAKRLVNHPSNGPLERRIRHILKVARDFAVDGIIQYSSWGCHQSSGNVMALGRAIEGAGYKFLNLNGDAVDPRNASFEQMRTRIEAFLEG